MGTAVSPVRCLGSYGLQVAAALAGVLFAVSAAAGDLDLTPLGVWPEFQLRSTFNGVPDGALANGRFFQPGAYRGGPALLALEPRGANPFQLVGALPLPYITRLAITGHHAIIVGSGRLFVVDISDPVQLQFEGMVWIGSVAYEPGVPLALAGTHAYVVRRTEDLPGASPARITVVDFSDPRHPRIVGEPTFPPTAATAFWLSEAAAADGVLCVASSSTDWQSPIQVVLDIFDLRDPAQPRWVGKHEAAKMEDVHALGLVGRRAYWAPFAFSGTTRSTKLQVVDLTDPTAPKLLGTYSTTGEVKNLAANERYVYAAKAIQTVTGEGSAVDIVDVGDPAAPKRVGGSTVKTFDTDPTLYIEGGLMVVRSFYGGTSAYDISEPATMRRLGGHNDLGMLHSTVIGNRAFVVGIGHMSILDVSQPEAPRLLGAYPLPSDLAYLGKVAVAGNYAYLPTSAGLQTIDVTDPAAPRRTSVFRSTSYFTGAAVEGNLLAAASSDDGVFFLDLTDPARPASRGRADLRFNNIAAKSVAVSGQRAFVTSADELVNASSGVLEIFDATDPALPQYLGACEVPAVPVDVAVSGGLAVVTSNISPSDDSGQADILDVHDPSNPVLLASYETRWGARVSLVEDQAILGGPQVVDLSDPTQPRRRPICPETPPAPHRSRRALTWASGGRAKTGCGDPPESRKFAHPRISSPSVTLRRGSRWGRCSGPPGISTRARPTQRSGQATATAVVRPTCSSPTATWRAAGKPTGCPSPTAIAGTTTVCSIRRRGRGSNPPLRSNPGKPHPEASHPAEQGGNSQRGSFEANQFFARPAGS